MELREFLQSFSLSLMNQILPNKEREVVMLWIDAQMLQPLDIELGILQRHEHWWYIMLVVDLVNMAMSVK